MTTKDNNGQEFLTQMYDMQQQYMKNLQQMMQPQQPVNPMEQMWNSWASGNQFTGNPFAQMQNPLTDWMNTGTGSMNNLYQQMNEQFKSQLQNPFASSMMPGLSNLLKMPEIPNMNQMNAPIIELMQNLFSEDDRAKGEALLHSLQDYQTVTMEINQLMSQLAIDSLEQLQQKVAEHDQTDLQNVPQWWMEITKTVLEGSQSSDTYKELQQKLEMVQQKLSDDRDQYREALAENLGLVSEKTYQAMQMQIEALQEQIKELSANTVNEEAVKAAADDFTVLNGIGQKFNEKLHEQGVKNLNQLASMSDDMLKNLDSELQAKGKVFQDQWREQAESFLNAMSGKNSNKK